MKINENFKNKKNLSLLVDQLNNDLKKQTAKKKKKKLEAHATVIKGIVKKERVQRENFTIVERVEEN